MTLLASLLLAAAVPTSAAAPAPGSDAAVMAPIAAMFAGLAAHDGAAILAAVDPEGGATVAAERADGTRLVRHLSWAAFAGGIKPGPERLEERLAAPLVRIDGDVAMVWARYTFLIDDKPHHCGIDHFDLVRRGATWKVLNVTWSQRTTGCGG